MVLPLSYEIREIYWRTCLLVMPFNIGFNCAKWKMLYSFKRLFQKKNFFLRFSSRLQMLNNGSWLYYQSLANNSVMITESQFFAFMFCVSFPLLGLLMSKSPARRFREETSLTRCSLLFWWSYVANSWKAVPSSVLYQRFIGIQVSIIQCSSIAEEKNKNSAKYHKR